MDLSGSKTIIEGDIKPGPGVDFPGSSAFFNGDNYLFAKHSKDLNSRDLTFSFWIYLISFNEDGKGVNLKFPLILKGEDDILRGNYQRYPGIFIDEETRKLRIYASLQTPGDFKDVKQKIFNFFNIKLGDLDREFGKSSTSKMD